MKVSIERGVGGNVILYFYQGQSVFVGKQDLVLVIHEAREVNTLSRCLGKLWSRVKQLEETLFPVLPVLLVVVILHIVVRELTAPVPKELVQQIGQDVCLIMDPRPDLVNTPPARGHH